MSYLLFLDESGHDRKESPFEVLAGIAIKDSSLWPLVQAVHELEIDCFGQRYATNQRELKATKILKRKVFRHAGQCDPIDVATRRADARACLNDGGNPSSERLAALGQAKLDFVKRALLLCAKFDCKAVASIVKRNAPRPEDAFLRKDYAYLFERFFYLLEDQPGTHQGLVVFDELDRSLSHLLVDQMSTYFRGISKGRKRSERIIPEPFFVHSHLTTGVQLADLIAYIAAWGMQVGSMPPAKRPELGELGALVAALEYHTTRKAPAAMPWQKEVTYHSFALLDDLRPRRQRKRRRPSQK